MTYDQYTPEVEANLDRAYERIEELKAIIDDILIHAVPLDEHSYMISKVELDQAIARADLKPR